LTSEQRQFVDLAAESIKAARLLAEHGMNRFAVSRAYYAMFYCAQAVLLAKQMAFSKHSAVVSAFGAEFAKADLLPAKLHRYLIEAAAMREDGDYDLAAVIEDSDCERQVARAKEFLDHAQSFLA
jgi:uncharacterized protein (UPF0332 family)